MASGLVQSANDALKANPNAHSIRISGSVISICDTSSAKNATFCLITGRKFKSTKKSTKRTNPFINAIYADLSVTIAQVSFATNEAVFAKMAIFSGASVIEKSKC